MSNRKKSSRKLASKPRPVIFAPSATRLRVLAGVILIILVVFLAYLPSLSGGFIWDDEVLLTDNSLIKASDGLYRFWCTTEAYDYWPVVNSTFWIEWRLWGMNPTGYHVTNLILHIIESLLIWLILRKMSIPGAFMAAMLFAVHPVNVESVAWIAQRKNTMAMFFFLVSILWYLKMEIPSLSAQNSLYRVPSSIFYWLSLAAFTLAMLSKGSVAILPVLLLGIVWWRRSLTRWDAVRTAPFFVVAAVLGGVNVWYQNYVMGEVIRGVSLAERLMGAGGVVWFYLYKAFLPVNLIFVYPQWNVKAGNPLWWLPLLAVLAVTAALWWYRRGWSRPLLFAWGFFCVTLAPVMGFTYVGFMQYSMVADHYQHIAIIGAVALAAAGWSIWHQRIRGLARLAANTAVFVAVATLALLTWRQSGLYRDAMTLYRATLEKNPECWVAHNNLAIVLTEIGRLQEATEHYEQALRLKTNYPEAHNNLGNILVQTGQLQEAIEHFQQAVRLKTYYPEAQNNLGGAMVQAGRPQEAIEHFKQALQLNPDYINAYNNLSLAYASMHQSADAIATAQKAIKLAQSQGQTELARQIEDWLNSYRAGLTDLPSALPPSKSATPTP